MNKKNSIFYLSWKTANNYEIIDDSIKKGTFQEDDHDDGEEEANYCHEGAERAQDFKMNIDLEEQECDEAEGQKKDNMKHDKKEHDDEENGINNKDDSVKEEDMKDSPV